MSNWIVPDALCLTASAASPSPCFDYARDEAARLLGRLGVAVELREKPARAGHRLCFGLPGEARLPAARIAADGYVLRIGEQGACVAAPTAKGVLNGVYDLAERMGFLFLMPGDDGEWAPDLPTGRPTVPAGEWRVEPRFPYRGIFGGLTVWPFKPEEWLRFFAKLRFNAQADRTGSGALLEQLGIRCEVGGHGMASLLPRELFAEKPELFRLFQPEDFSGKRMPDSNFCPTNPETARLVRDNFRRQLAGLHGVYAVHAWADDLPGGGWCMCSRCRAFSASDQSMLAMNLQAEAIAQAGLPMRVPVIAYHDTMCPGRQVLPAPECFLLYAPRERCYAHALDDTHCARNRWFLKALRDWMKVFAKHEDAHTFEYYNDQILFRGLYPFLPDVILGDTNAYRRAGIRTHMSLQVGGALIAPDHNMLAFARANWDAGLTAERLIAELAQGIDPSRPAPWQSYLQARRAAYTAALAVCETPTDVYFDYRFMPEVRGPYGETLVRSQADGADTLRDAADALENAAKSMPPRAAALAAREVARSRFESEDLRAMSLHQSGLNRITEYLNGHDAGALRGGLDSLERTLAQLERADAAATAAGIPDRGGPYYHGFNRDWSAKEIREKIRVYRQGITPQNAVVRKR